MDADLVLRNGNIATEAGVFQGSVAIQGGKIAQLLADSEPIEARETIDLNGNTVLPGLVDEHVHFNEPGRTHWEGYRTGSMAAAAGGVTTIFEMPLNSIPATTNLNALEEKRRAVVGESVVDYAQWGGLVKGNTAQLAGMHAAGVIGFKAFLSNSGVAEFERINDDDLYSGLILARDMGSIIGLHAENEEVTRLLGEKMRSQGRTNRSSWTASRPALTELEAIQRACYWAKQTGGTLHIVHVSITDGIHAISRAKREGATVYSETCPHYLCLDGDDFERIGPAAKCAPPLRSREEVEALWACVLKGEVDTIGSDHSPCNWEEKEKGLKDIWKAWGGVSGIQTMLPILLTEGFHKRGLKLTDIVRLTSGNPARIYGIYPQKGALQVGSDADLVIVDVDEEWMLAREDLFYKNKVSPYIGNTFKGRVKRTIVRGRSVYSEGQILAEPGYGKLICRGYS